MVLTSSKRIEAGRVADEFTAMLNDPACKGRPPNSTLLGIPTGPNDLLSLDQMAVLAGVPRERIVAMFASGGGPAAIIFNGPEGPTVNVYRKNWIQHAEAMRAATI